MESMCRIIGLGLVLNNKDPVDPAQSWMNEPKADGDLGRLTVNTCFLYNYGPSGPVMLKSAGSTTL